MNQGLWCKADLLLSFCFSYPCLNLPHQTLRYCRLSSDPRCMGLSTSKTLHKVGITHEDTIVGSQGLCVLVTSLLGTISCPLPPPVGVMIPYTGPKKDRWARTQQGICHVGSLVALLPSPSRKGSSG